MKDAYLEGVDKNSLENQLRDLKRRVKALELKKVKINSLDELTTDQGLLLKGEFRAGNEVEPGSGFTGGRFGYPGFVYDGVVYFFVGVNNDVLAVGIELATGKVVFGNKNGWLDENGLKIVVNNASTANAKKAIEFVNAAGVAQYGIYSGDWGISGTGYGLKITTPGGAIELIITNEGVSITGSRVLTIDDFPDMGNTEYGNNGIGITTTLNMSASAAIKGIPETILDDAATSFTPATARGVLILRSGGANPTIYGMFTYAAIAGTAYCYAWTGAGSAMAAATGALAGTTGTDGKVTVSAHTDGKIYIENRSGGSLSFTWNILAGA